MNYTRIVKKIIYLFFCILALMISLFILVDTYKAVMSDPMDLKAKQELKESIDAVWKEVDNTMELIEDLLSNPNEDDNSLQMTGQVDKWI